MWFVGSSSKRALHFVTSAEMPGPQPLSLSAYICKSVVLTEDTKRYVLLQAILSAPRTFRNTNKVAPQQAYPPLPQTQQLFGASWIWAHDEVPLVILIPVSNFLRPSSCSIQLRKCYWKTSLATGFVG